MKNATLLVGEGRLSYSIAACLLRAGHSVTMIHRAPRETSLAIERHLAESSVHMPLREKRGKLSVISDSKSCKTGFALAILITRDRIEEKALAISVAENLLLPEGVIAINLESIELAEIQSLYRSPERILGLNWVEPAHTTFFLEIIGNSRSDRPAIESLRILGLSWNKDPYIISSGFSVKARLHAALTREALYLVRNGFADYEDIDRNCRNDAGYYLPFTGNARYMDLMGTSAYGIVMKDLNQSLSRDAELDRETTLLAEKYPSGMKGGKGFFDYSEDDIREWEQKMETFSYQIHHLMKKYPFEKTSDRII